MILLNQEKFKKENLLAILEKNGFKTYSNNGEILATKGEHELHFNNLMEFSHKINFRKVFAKINYQKEISGIPQKELKKLIKEERKTTQFLFDTFLFIINKLNWAQRFSAEFDLPDDQKLKIVEFYDESDNVYNFLFLQKEDDEYMFITNKSHKEIYGLINSLLEIEIEDLIPEITLFIED